MDIKPVRKDQYVASYRFEDGKGGEDGDNGEILRRFRERELDVLVNVNILTEGVDIPSIRTVKGWYGKAFWERGFATGQGTIRINSLLDSPDVPREVMLYLLWHEYLHLYLQQSHTTVFRRMERSWPGYSEADRWLLNLNERFGVQWW